MAYAFNDRHGNIVRGTIFQCAVDEPSGHRGRIIDVTDKSYTIELTGDQTKNDAFLEAIERTAILETVRTGSSGIGRGERVLRV